MAGDIKNKYGSSNQAITITLASLANSSAGVGRASAAVDNSSNLFADALVTLKVKTGGSGVSATGAVYVYAYGTSDGGTTYTEGATGSDAAITLTQPVNARLIGIVNAVANATTYISGPFSVAKAFDYNLPDHWGIVVVNSTGAALDATGGNHSVVYQGVYAQYS